MKIEGVIWLRTVIDKLALKHNVEPHEVEEVFGDKPKVRFMEDGQLKGENVYMMLGANIERPVHGGAIYL